MAITAKTDAGFLRVGVAVITSRTGIGMPVAVILHEIGRMRLGIVAAPGRAIDVAREACGIATVNIMA